MNETDLVEVLRDRADVRDTAHRVRMAGVRAKVRAARRRQAVAAAGCLVVVLLGVVYGTGLPRIGSTGPAGPPGLGGQQPAYRDGLKMVTGASTSLPSRETDMWYTPKDDDFRIYAYCSIGGQPSDAAVVTVDDQVWHDGACAERGTVVAPPADWSPSGRAVRVSMIVPEPAHDTGTLGFRIGEPVPFEEYALPPRPAELAPLTVQPPYVQIARSRPDPTTRHESTLLWPDVDALELVVNAPGRVRVLVNGVEVVDDTRWEYGVHTAPALPVAEWARAHGLRLDVGDEVKITVVPAHATGNWLVKLRLKADR